MQAVHLIKGYYLSCDSRQWIVFKGVYKIYYPSLKTLCELVPEIIARKECAEIENIKGFSDIIKIISESADALKKIVKLDNPMQDAKEIKEEDPLNDFL